MIEQQNPRHILEEFYASKVNLAWPRTGDHLKIFLMNILVPDMQEKRSGHHCTAGIQGKPA